MLTRHRQVLCTAIIFSLPIFFAGKASSQTQAAPAATAPAATAPVADSTAAPKPARRRFRRQRASTQQQPATTQAAKQPIISAEQRQRDAQILELQKEQQAQTAKENAATTAKVVAERQRQQDEPRIQDAPGPGDQPTPGSPAVTPAQGSDQRIQDAPGPAQTLPKPPADSGSTSPQS